MCLNHSFNKRHALAREHIHEITIGLNYLIHVNLVFNNIALNICMLQVKRNY